MEWQKSRRGNSRTRIAGRYNLPVRLTPRNLSWLLKRSLIATFDDGCIGSAKGAAYSALLSFFPMLTSAAAIMVQTKTEFVSHYLENLLKEIVPPGTEDLVVQQFSVMGERPLTLLIVAAMVSLWAASGVFKSLIEGFHYAYRVPRDRGFFHGTAVAMALVLMSAIPLIAASVLILFGGGIERLVLGWLKVDPVFNPLASVWQWASRVTRYVVAFAGNAAVTAMLYYFGPNRKQRWHFVWPGAILATLAWLIATTVFAWYVRNIARYNVMYGSIGAAIALLVWMYLLALIALVGCEFNAAYERSSAPPPSATIPR
jgi:membrane protein